MCVYSIENIHVMRDSLIKLESVLRMPTPLSIDELYMQVAGSGWLRHMSLVLKGVAMCAKYVHTGNSLLIHCSDGNVQLHTRAQHTRMQQLIIVIIVINARHVCVCVDVHVDVVVGWDRT